MQRGIATQGSPGKAPGPSIISKVMVIRISRVGSKFMVWRPPVSPFFSRAKPCHRRREWTQTAHKFNNKILLDVIAVSVHDLGMA